MKNGLVDGDEPLIIDHFSNGDCFAADLHDMVSQEWSRTTMSRTMIMIMTIATRMKNQMTLLE